jgi:hypothetical protein
MSDNASLETDLIGNDDGMTDTVNSVVDALDAYTDKVKEANQVNQKETEVAGETNEEMSSLSDLYALLNDKLTELNQSTDVANHYLENLTSTAKKSTEENQKNSFSLTELNSGLDIINKTLGYAKQAYEATIGVSMEYTQSIHDLAVVSGQSMEQTSRMVQVLDDSKISISDIEAATRKLTANGLAPNMETIARLSEEYGKITDVEERNKFMVENLGRASTQWNLALSQGKDALLAQAGAIDINLIATDKMYRQSEQLRLAQDQLNDTVEGLKIKIGSELTPIMANWLTLINNSTDWQARWSEQIQRTNGAAMIPAIGLLLSYSDAQNENEQKIIAAAEAEKRKAEATRESTITAEEAAAAADKLSEAYSRILQSTQAMDSALATHDTSIENLKKQQSDLETQLKNTPAWETKKIDDFKAKLSEIPGKMQEVEAQYAEATAKMAYDNYVAKASVDGLTSAEFNQAQQVGVALGLFTQATADRAVAMDELTSKLADGKITIDEFNQAVKDGSLKVDEANKVIITGYDEVSRTVKTKNDEAAVSAGEFSKTVQDKTDANEKQIDDYNKKVTDSADITKTKTQASVDSWNNWSDGVQENVDYAILAIDDYIKKVGEIPAVPPAQLPPANESNNLSSQGSQSQGAGNVIRHVIDIFVNGSYQESRTLI